MTPHKCGVLFYKYNMKKQSKNDLNEYIIEKTKQELLKEILTILSQMSETMKRIEKTLDEHAKFARGGF